MLKVNYNSIAMFSLAKLIATINIMIMIMKLLQCSSLASYIRSYIARYSIRNSFCKSKVIKLKSTLKSLWPKSGLKLGRMIQTIWVIFWWVKCMSLICKLNYLDVTWIFIEHS